MMKVCKAEAEQAKVSVRHARKVRGLGWVVDRALA